MAKIPVRFKRVAAVFDSEVARARLCESSGSEHSTDLSDLVNSFLEREYKGGGTEDVDGEIGGEKSELERKCSDYESMDALKGLFGCQADGVKRSIHGAVEKALAEVKFSTPDFKRPLMARLRRRGFDAGLCKSNWGRVGECPPGNYEYIDVLMSGSRYIIEVSLAKEFDIARPTGSYSALLEIFPSVFVGKVDELKQITRLMCKSIKKSMKSADMSLPPWRRLAYMQAKWFGSYKRTVNEFPAQKALSSAKDLTRNRLVGFGPMAAC